MNILISLIALSGLSTGCPENSSSPLAFTREHRRLTSTRGTSLIPIRISYIYQNFDLGSENTSFKDIVMNAVDEFLESVLQVYPLEGSLVISGENCGNYITIPYEHKTAGLLNTDVIIYLTSINDSSEGFSVSGSACYLEPNNYNNVVAGFLRINTAYFSGSSFNTQFVSVMHEMVHVLGFSSHLFPFFHSVIGSVYGEDELYTRKEIRGTTKTIIKSPTVVAKAREASGCTSLDGFELEDAEGELGSHWDMRVAYYDLMVTAVTPNPVFSTVTFALLEDSGWYSVVWDYLHPLIFGKNQGCDFYDNNCVKDGVAEFTEFCHDTLDKCDLMRINKAKCNAKNYTDPLPEHFQYFPSNLTGGAIADSDYCPLPVAIVNGDCRATAQINPEYGERICENCRCMEGTLSTVEEIYHTGCYEVVECLTSSAVIRVYDTSNEAIDVECPFTGGQVSVTGFQGLLNCPSSDVLCADVPCINSCYGQGKCTSGACECNSGRSESDCSDGCHASCGSCTGTASTQCTSCSGFQNNLQADGTCGCNEGYYLANGVCEIECNSNCLECDESDVNICTSCYENMSVVSNSCVCNDGYEAGTTENTCIVSVISASNIVAVVLLLVFS